MDSSTGAFERVRPAAKDTFEQQAERAVLNAEVNPHWMHYGSVLGERYQLGCLLADEGRAAEAEAMFRTLLSKIVDDPTHIACVAAH
jgi:hypothetical protein